MANGIISSLQIGSGDVGVFTTPYGVCSTSAETAAKTVTVNGDFVLATGARVMINFSKGVQFMPSATLSLNVNSTGAKYIRLDPAESSGSDYTLSKYFTSDAGRVYEFVYDGTYWLLLTRDHDTDTNTTYTGSTPISVSGTTISHSTADGYKHVASGGSSSQYLVGKSASSNAGATAWADIFGKKDSGTYSTILGNLSAYNSTSKTGNTVTGEGSIAIGNGNNVTDAYSFTQGYQNSNNTGRGFISGELNTLDTTGGGFSAAFGKSNSIKGNVHHIYAFGSENTCNVTDSSAAHDCILGGYKNTLGNEDVSCGIALGYNNTVTGNAVIGPVALGQSNTSSGMGSFACGVSNSASGGGAVAIGQSHIVSGGHSSALGYDHTVYGAYNSVAGNTNLVYGTNNTVLGSEHKLGYSTSYEAHYCTLLGRGHLIGNSTTSGVARPAYLTVVGRYSKPGRTGQTVTSDTVPSPSNNAGTDGPYLFVVGNGTSTTAQSTAMRVSVQGNVALTGALYENGAADYAECFEWSDGNKDNEDRRGRFVTFDYNETIRYATEKDDYILGIVSATPCIVGDSYHEDWQGRYKKDIYGQILYEDYEIPAEYDEEGKEIVPATIVPKPIDNEDFDPEKEYIPRLNRPEWTIIGMLGKLIVNDDGTCEVNGYAKPGKDGIATKGSRENGYRVIARIDENHIKVLFK